MDNYPDAVEMSLKSQYQSEAEVSFVDSLTGLFNHGFFQMSLGREIDRSRRYGVPFNLILVDIDSFSDFNKRRSHLQGDRILSELAYIIKNNIRVTDLAARFSGDVIAVIMINALTESAVVLGERIRQGFEEQTGGCVTLSVGIASCSGADTDRESLLDMACHALSSAKMKGKNRVQVFGTEESIVLEDTPTVLVVDDEPKNVKLLKALLEHKGYEVAVAGCGKEALSIVKKVDIDLVLLDVMMPGIDGYEVCRHLKQNPSTRLIPVVMVTALDDEVSRIKGIEAGADDFISKPPNHVELMARVKSLVKVKMLNNSLTSIENVLFSVANIIEAKDAYTQGHITRVSNLAVDVGRRMGLTKKQIAELRIGGILHDIGKIGVPEEILNKPGALEPDEWETMKAHPVIGYRIAMPLKKNLGCALEVIRHHHEKLDGSGYPDGIIGNEIGVEAKIMAVVDSYDALITDRPYRKGMTREKTFQILRNEAGAGKLDKDVVACLIEMIGETKSI